MTRLEIAVALFSAGHWSGVSTIEQAFDKATEFIIEEAERDADYKDMASVRQALDARKILEREAEAEGSVPF